MYRLTDFPQKLAPAKKLAPVEGTPRGRRFLRLVFLPLCLGLGLMPGLAAAGEDSQLLLYYRMNFGAGTEQAQLHGLGLALQREPILPGLAQAGLGQASPGKTRWTPRAATLSLDPLATRGGNMEWARYGDGRVVLRLNGLDYWSSAWVLAADEEAPEGAEGEQSSGKPAFFKWLETLPLGVWIGVGFGAVLIGGAID